MIVFDVDQIGPWVCERAGGTYFPGTCQGIGYEQDGELTAGVLYDQCNGRSVQMHVALDQPLTKGFTRIAFDYPFNQLKVQKVIGLVDSGNTKALHLDRKLGFVDEAQIKDAGKTGDLMILSMTKAQCRWIK